MVKRWFKIISITEISIISYILDNFNASFVLVPTLYSDKTCSCRSSGVPGIPRQGGQAAASIHFSDGGGGG